MSIVDVIRGQRRDALLRSDKIKLSILTVALGEIESAQSRKSWRDGDEVGIIKKLIDSNRYTIKASPTAVWADDLKHENEILQSLLPKEATYAELASQLTLVSTDILASGSFGKGMGIAMKFVKEKGINADGKLVKRCVEKMFNK